MIPIGSWEEVGWAVLTENQRGDSMTVLEGQVSSRRQPVGQEN